MANDIPRYLYETALSKREWEKKATHQSVVFRRFHSRENDQTTYYLEQERSPSTISFNCHENDHEALHGLLD